MRLVAALLAIGGGVGGLAACSPYSPDLGPAPFFCGDSEPRCPEGYTCTLDEADGVEVCQNGPIPGVSCADDSEHEPNNMLATATMMSGDALDDLAICPAGDRDLYAIDIATANQNLEIVVELQPGGAILDGAILNAGGVPIAVASQRGTPVSALRAYAADLSAGTYYVQVVGPSSGTNSYKLSIDITGP